MAGRSAGPLGVWALITLCLQDLHFVLIIQEYKTHSCFTRSHVNTWLILIISTKTIPNNELRLTSTTMRRLQMDVSAKNLKTFTSQSIWYRIIWILMNSKAETQSCYDCSVITRSSVAVLIDGFPPTFWHLITFLNKHSSIFAVISTDWFSGNFVFLFEQHMRLLF